MFFVLVSNSATADDEQKKKEIEKSKISNSLTGIIRVVGSAYNSKVVISKESGSDQGQTSFCKGEVAKKLGRLSGMTLKVTGSWVERNIGRGKKARTKRCFFVSQFTIEKGSNGRKPLVGVLSKIDSSYQVKTEDGTSHNLERVTTGLKELVGKKVIVDVKPLSGATGEKSWKVVSYSAYP